MNIPYALRSKFTSLCQEGITAQQEALNAGQTITIPLEPKGYTGNVVVIIEAANQTEFQTDWSASDPTRFPARLKAAATALRDCGYWGSFAMSHAEGVLSIKKAA